MPLPLNTNTNLRRCAARCAPADQRRSSTCSEAEYISTHRHDDQLATAIKFDDFDFIHATAIQRRTPPPFHLACTNHCRQHPRHRLVGVRLDRDSASQA